ncbi:hypothetical protein H4R18_003738 [Coemansia javaensis]|uniref:Uncharacterized protein n=1 Tax=Coemansia javaensis TaxID=2761396 RepID=A0A9W8HCU4_9FUNG|nr:hypothetical protein H4R18_003738 [Coemansia javaensis]
MALHTLLAAALALGLALALCARAQQTPQARAQPFTVSMETTYRPEHTGTGYSPMPLTPDLGRIADSVAAEPSAAAAMRQARAAWGMDATKDEL